MDSFPPLPHSSDTARAVYDVVVHTPRTNCSPVVVEEFPQPDLPISLGKDVVVSRLNEQLTNKLFVALESPGIRPPNAHRIREYWQLYSFVRRVGEVSDRMTGSWDGDGVLRTCVALSRLVHPTTQAFRFSARVVTLPDGSIEWIHPGIVGGHGSIAFVSTVENRDWLTNQEFGLVASLIARFDSKKWPRRLVRSLWYHEYSSLMYELDVRWVVMTTALEALIHTDRPNSGGQFRERVFQLAAMVGVNCSKEEVALAYDQRSQLAHGQHFVDMSGGIPAAAKAELSGEVIRSYRRMEEILRACLLKAANEDQFASIFASDDSIRLRLPI